MFHVKHWITADKQKNVSRETLGNGRIPENVSRETMGNGGIPENVSRETMNNG